MNSYVRRINIAEPPSWASKSPLLTSLDFELTERCNNNCIHCCINLPANDRKARSREMSTGEISKILREAADLGCLTVKFTGGEPLLRDDFEELYLCARNLGLKVVLFTNATLITARLAELLRRIPPLEPIEITVYGLKRKSYEAVTRTSGSFAASRKGIRRLLEKKIPFVVKGAILPANRNELADFEKWARRMPGMNKPPSCAMFFDLRGRRDSAAKNRQIRKLRLSPEEGLEIMAANPEVYRREMDRFCSAFMRTPGRKLFRCGAGLRSGCVDAYGNLQLCLTLRHPDTVYNLRQGSLKDGLARFFPGVRRKPAANPEYLKKCAVCFLKGLCEQCPAKSWAEHGTLDKPVAYLCRLAHRQARFLNLLKKGQKAWQSKMPVKRPS